MGTLTTASLAANVPTIVHFAKANKYAHETRDVKQQEEEEEEEEVKLEEVGKHEMGASLVLCCAVEGYG